MYKCAVRNCGWIRGRSRHKIPLDEPGRLKLWLEFLHLDANTPVEVFRDCRVCEFHFTEEDYAQGRKKSPKKLYRLKRSAVPTLYRGTKRSEELGAVCGAEAEPPIFAVPQSTPVKDHTVPGTHSSFYDAGIPLILRSPEGAPKSRKSLSGSYLAYPAIRAGSTLAVTFADANVSKHRGQTEEDHQARDALVHARQEQVHRNHGNPARCEDADRLETNHTAGSIPPQPPAAIMLFVNQNVVNQEKGGNDELARAGVGVQELATLGLNAGTYIQDVNQLLETKEEVPSEQPECSSSLDQDPARLHIKEEQEEVLTSQEGEQLQKLEETDIKSEEDEEKPQSSQLHQSEQIKTETDGDDCEESEEARTSHPGRLLPPVSDEETSDSDTTGSTCAKRFPAMTDMDTDMETHSSEEPFSCSMCGKLFHKEGHLKSHMINTHTTMQKCTPVEILKKANFSCSECGKTFVQRAPLLAHQRFSEKGNLISHLRIPTGEKRFSCSFCGNKLVVISSFGDMISCSECGKKFSSRKSMMRHMMTHTAQKFSCSVCGKSLTKPGLQYHMKIHTREKSFSCSECGKKFSFESSIKRHMMTHTVKKFSCSVCNKSFSKSRLPIHMKNHVGKTFFDCSECGKKFSYRSNLNRHMLSHTEEKPVGHDSDSHTRSEPDHHLKPDLNDEVIKVKVEEDCDEWKEISEPQASVDSLGDDDKSDVKCDIIVLKIT